ncbi:hypothetical protein FSP39_006532 [Pinctada imbricata]|uniref:Cytochrome P450 n=1 Tax=Pinctada imbricata TaxID=66713 RepID=A0AA88YL73_PINIB|nr:hypothetical protein FSP39_006532 [Pinctada imbricata]
MKHKRLLINQRDQWATGADLGRPSATLIADAILIILNTKWKRNLPPGPRGFPLIGSIIEMKSKDRTEDFARLRKQYGDVFYIKLGLSEFIVINGTKALQELIVKRADALSDRPAFMASRAGSTGIAATSGDLWKEQRTFAIRTLRSFGVGKRCLETQVMDEVTILVNEIEKLKGSPFDISHLLSISISNIICSIVFGKRFEHDDEKFLLIMNLVHAQFSKTNLLGSGFASWLKYLPGDPTGIKESTERRDAIQRFLIEQIREHRQTFNKENIRDYIDAFLLEQQSQTSSESYYSDDQLLGTIRNFFNAGSDTTATTIRWAIYYLIRNPNIQAKMYEEIHTVIGDDVCPSMEHRKGLPYCEAVMAESQRLGNIVPLSVPHGVKYDVNWNGYVIPKGSTIILNLTSVCMDPVIFPKPKEFKPERFLTKDGRFEGKTQFFPFSLGRRICLGESLARMELFLFLVSIVQRFHILPEKEGVFPEVDVMIGITRSPSSFRFRAINRN